MVLVAVGKILTGSGNIPPAKTIGSKGIQIYSPGNMTWCKKSVILRNAPYTIDNPHPGQIETRLHFGSIASKGKHMKGLDPETGLPASAAIVSREMLNFTAPNRMPESAYPTASGNYASHVHSRAQLEAMLRKKLSEKTGQQGIPAMFGASPGYFGGPY